MAERGPYAEGAGHYLETGWTAPFPILPGEKSPPETNYTGYKAPESIDRKTITGWVNSRPNWNIALHLPDTIVGIDVDHYDKPDEKHPGQVIHKVGGEHLDDLQDQLCALPATFRSSARSDAPRSGIIFYRIPRGLHLCSNLSDSIEVVRTGHRYAVAWPSTRNDLPGAVYQWYDKNNQLMTRPPKVEDLPDLPDKWIEYMTATGEGPEERKLRWGTGERPSEDNEPASAEAASWRRAFCGGKEDSYCRAVENTLKAAQKKLQGIEASKGRYETARDYCLGLERLAGEGHLGVRNALIQLKNSYYESVRGEKRDPTEWRRFLDRGYEKVMIANSKDAEGNWIVEQHAPGECPNKDQDFVDHCLANGGTDLHNAEMVFEYFGSEIALAEPLAGEKDSNNWYVFDGEVWRQDTSRYYLAKKITATSYELAQRASQIEDADLRKKMDAPVNRMQSSNGKRACLDQMSQVDSVNVVDRRKFDAQPFLFNHPTGTLELRSGGEVNREFRAEDMLTKRCATVYDVNAPVPKEWSAFIKRAVGGDRELAQFLQRACYASLTGSTRDKCFINLFDDQVGNTGKTGFMEIIGKVIGTDYSSDLDQETFVLTNGPKGIRSDLAMMLGKRMVMANEMDGDARLNVPLMKKLTAGTGDFTFELKYVNQFSAPMTFTIWMDGNQKPRVSSEHAPLFARWKLVPFTNEIPFEQREEGWVERMLSTPGFKSGVLNWMLKGHTWHELGIGSCAAVEAAQEVARKEGDLFLDFWETRKIEFTGNHGDFVGAKEIYDEMMVWWAEHHSQSMNPPHARKLAEAMKQHGAEQIGGPTSDQARWGKDVRDRKWHGIKFGGIRIKNDARN